MYDKHQWSLTLVLHLLLVVVVGIALNAVPAPFDSSGIAVFGVGVGVYAALRFPPVIAIPIALVICVPLWLTHGSIVGKESLSLLPIVVSLFGYKKSLSRVIKVGAGFWSLIFLPILLLEHALYEADQPTMMFSGVLVTWVSGVFGLISGHFVFLANKGLKHTKTGSQEKVSLHFLFSYFFSGCFFAASMAVVYLSVALYQDDQEAQIIRYMQQRVAVLEQQLSDFIGQHQKAIAVASQSLSTPYAIEKLEEASSNQLSVLAAHYPEFITFLVADESGNITHSYPPGLLNKAQAVGAGNVAYRPYFSQAMETGGPYLSNVFQGQGFGNDAIVAMSSPILNDNGAPIGIVEGSLSLRSFSTVDALNLDGFSLLLEDAKGEVIYASDALGLKPLNKAPAYSCDGECDIKIEDGPLNKQWLRLEGQLPTADWQVSYYYDYRRFLSAMSEYLLIDLLLLLALSVFGTFMGSVVARMIESPIRRLIRYIANFTPSEVRREATLAGSTLHIQELASLNDEFSSLEGRLFDAFKALEFARAKEQALNVELAEFNHSLENKIEEKTRHLATALEEAKAASVAKTQFLANMSHEIRTPMNGIIGSCELMMELPLPDGARHRTETISTSASHLLMILDSILDWSKIESGKMLLDKRSVSVAQTIDACSVLYERSASKKGISIDVSIDENVPQVVITDGGKLSQIINNLVSNAIKFTHQGTILVEANYSYTQGELYCSVTDSGIGIPPEKIDSIFDQFEQADASITRDYGGTGLGLAITKGLVELLGGSITVESTEGTGTTFYFSFPCEKGETQEATSNVKAHSLPSTLRVLLAEDNDVNADIVMDMLGSVGVKRIRAKNGIEAIEAAKRHTFDVILMDYQMPVMDGLTASKQIRQHALNKDSVIIIALTANAYADDKAACIAAGMNAHLSKPIRKQVLIDSIARELARV
ncbi:ATP-binding protein [Alteromonas lipotrueae]|uniref:ATP-binding protein n=1 Tax=Alteromonas lipotrueae TaxID=2803814 RepID=UPI001C495800|nr:ATP-binding protein [Alteromonas lipotrueae]